MKSLAKCVSSVVSELLEERRMMAATYGGSGQPWPVGPGQISWVEAENFDLGGQGIAYNDTTAGNQGGKYRLTDSVDIEGPSVNAGGTFRTSFATASEWLTYTVDVQQAGQYQLRVRTAAAGTGGTARVWFNGSDKTGVMTIGSTGGWDVWQNSTAMVDLPAGVQVMRLEIVSGSFNTDYLSLQPLADVGGPQAYSIRGLPPLIPTWGSVRVEAENYDTGGQGVGYFEADGVKSTTATLNGQPFRATDLIDTSNRGTGISITHWQPGDWVEHTIFASNAGTYELRASIAKGDTVATTLNFSVNGVQQQSLVVPNTGDWYTFNSIPSALTLTAGKNNIRVTSPKGQVNLDYYDLRRAQTFGNNFQAWQVPASGPVRIEAENFDVTPSAYIDLTPGNSGNTTYRPGTDVDLRTTTAGVAVTGVQAGEALEYSILASLDGYNTLSVFYASVTDQQVRILFGGVDRTGVLTLPATGSQDTFTTLQKKILSKAGDQVMRIEALSDGLNLNWTQLEKVTTTPVVQVGGGSYASEPPQEALSTNTGLFDRVYDKVYDWIDRPANSAVPTNDWYTAILDDTFAGSLWAYPHRLQTSASGVNFSTFSSLGASPSNINYGTSQSLSIGAASGTFTRDAMVNYGDWTVEFRMEQSATQFMDVTMGRGLPYAWFEFSNTFVPKLNVGGTFTAFSSAGAALGTTFVADAFRISKGGQEFGVFAPAGTTFTLANGNYSVSFGGAQKYLVIAALPDSAQPTFDLFRNHAYAVPRDSRYDWSYDVDAGAVSTTWNMTSEVLMAGQSDQVIQGWLPHNYRDVLTAPNLLPGYAYLSINGPIKLSVGNSTIVVQPTNGVAFTLAAPEAIGGQADYDVAKMRSYLASYAAGDAAVPAYGNDTYFGAKALQQFAEFALMAKQMNDPTYSTFLGALRTSMTDWFTYTPGETEHYFAAYPRDGALIGFQPSFGSQNFTDNHFHYGYHTASAGVLAMLDPSWASSFGEMAKRVAKQYANWDRSDTNFPYLRTFEPWVGHSYAGGTGDARGNNQESTSEAIQSWLGLALLGQALNDPSMTAAGIMGYTVESKADLEYWFDAPHQDLFPDTFDKSNVAIKYDDSHSYGTFFGAQPEYILGIQGLPLWPSLDFLGRYSQSMINSVNLMLQQRATFYNDPTRNTWASFETTGANDWLNINLGILGQADPQAAANEFSRMISQNSPTSQKNQTGLYYYNIHSYRTYGKRDYTLHLSQPLGGVYKSDLTGRRTYVVYNAATTPQRVFVRDASGSVYDSFIAAARDTTVYEEQPNKTPTVAVAAAGMPNPVPGTSTTLSVLGDDDAGEANLSYAWQLLDGPVAVTFSRNNSNVAKATTATFTTAGAYSFRVTMTDAGGLSVTSDVAVTVSSTVTSVSVAPSSTTVKRPATAQFSAVVRDQFGDVLSSPVVWSVTGTTNAISSTGLLTPGTTSGAYVVSAASSGVTGTADVTVDASIFTGSQDIGAVALTGSTSSVVNDTVSMTASGSDIFGTADQFRYTYMPFNGDGQIVVRMASVQNTNNWAKAGLMFRESLAANARHASVFVTPAKGVSFQSRSTTGGNSRSVTTPGIVAPVWLKLVRSGNAFLGFRSADGTTWTGVGGLTTVAMSANAFVGLALTSHNNGALGTAVFERASVNAPTNLALMGTAVASSTAGGSWAAEAIDGNSATQWLSSGTGSQTLTVDLGSVKSVRRVTLDWGTTFARGFRLQTSNDGVTFTNFHSTSVGAGGTTDRAGLNLNARFVRVLMTTGTLGSYGVKELRVIG